MLVIPFLDEIVQPYKLPEKLCEMLKEG